MVRIFNPIIKLIMRGTVNKILGNLIYDKKVSECGQQYNIYDFEKSIFLSEARH